MAENGQRVTKMSSKSANFGTFWHILALFRLLAILCFFPEKVGTLGPDNSGFDHFGPILTTF